MKSENITLEGHQFTAIFNVKFEYTSGTYTRTRRGAHYADGEYEEDYYYEWFEGTGELHSKNSKKKLFFRFSTKKSERKEEKTFEEKLFEMKGAREQNKVIDRMLLIDFLCSIIWDSLKSQLKKKDTAMMYGISYTFTPLEAEPLIKAGVLTDQVGQIGIPII